MLAGRGSWLRGHKSPGVFLQAFQSLLSQSSLPVSCSPRRKNASPMQMFYTVGLRVKAAGVKHRGQRVEAG